MNECEEEDLFEKDEHKFNKVLSTSKENGGLHATIGLKKEASPKNGKENEVARSKDRDAKDKQEKEISDLF